MLCLQGSQTEWLCVCTCMCVHACVCARACLNKCATTRRPLLPIPTQLRKGPRQKDWRCACLSLINNLQRSIGCTAHQTLTNAISNSLLGRPLLHSILSTCPLLRIHSFSFISHHVQYNISVQVFTRNKNNPELMSKTYRLVARCASNSKGVPIPLKAVVYL